MTKHGVSPRIVQAQVVGTRGTTTVTGAQLQGIVRPADARGPRSPRSPPPVGAVTARPCGATGRVHPAPAAARSVTMHTPVLRGSVCPAAGATAIAIERAPATWHSWRRRDWAGAAPTPSGCPSGQLPDRVPRPRRAVGRGPVARRQLRLAAAMPGPLLAIDGPFVLYRSFFALPDSITDGEGHAGQRAAGRRQPDAADRRRPRPAGDRHLLRRRGRRLPDRAVSRLPRRPAAGARRAGLAVRAAPPELFAAFGWLTETTDDLEADDLLGRFAEAEVDAGGQALIMTGDRDMYQCAGEHGQRRLSQAALGGLRGGRPRGGAAPLRRRARARARLHRAARRPVRRAARARPGSGPRPRPSCWTARLAGGGDRRRRRRAPADRRGAARQRRRAAGLPRHRDAADRRRWRAPRTPRPTWPAAPQAARGLGMNRLAERLENAGSSPTSRGGRSVDEYRSRIACHDRRDASAV